MQQYSAQQNAVFHLLDRHIPHRANQIAIIDGEHAITYGALLTQVNELIANHSVCLDFKMGSLILCLFDDGIELVVMILALMRLGLVPCIINPNLPIEDYPRIIETIEPRMAFVGASKQFELKPIFLSSNTPYVVASSHSNSAQSHCHPVTAVQNESGAFGLFTSGTTGHPTLLIHRHQDPIQMAQTYGRKVLQLTPADVFFTTSKLFFAYGLNALFFAMLHGTTAILSPRDNALETIWSIITTKKPTVIFSVPTMYLRLMDTRPENPNISHTRLWISAGENLPSSLFTRWQTVLGVTLIDSIGTTETLSTFISNVPKQEHPGSTGMLVPGFLGEIRGENGTVLPHDKIGVLWIKGQTIPTQYTHNTQLTAERFVNGWFKTNDLFSCDADGRYTYHGRSNDLIKCGGIWIFPLRIEAALMHHPAILQAAIVGASDQGILRPAAFIVLKKPVLDLAALRLELKNWCKQKCSKYEYPHTIEVIDELPKTATGKIQRYKLKRPYPTV